MSEQFPSAGEHPSEQSEPEDAELADQAEREQPELEKRWFPLGQFTPAEIAYFIEMAGREYLMRADEELDASEKQRAETGTWGELPAQRIHDAASAGMRNLIEEDLPHAQAALDVMAKGTDLQKELAAGHLGSLLQREHEVNDNEHILVTAGNLVRIMHEENTDRINSDHSDKAISEYMDLKMGGAATRELIDLVGNYHADQSTGYSTRWLRPDLHKWFDAELRHYLPGYVIHD